MRDSCRLQMVDVNVNFENNADPEDVTVEYEGDKKYTRMGKWQHVLTCKVPVLNFILLRYNKSSRVGQNRLLLVGNNAILYIESSLLKGLGVEPPNV